jgi:hypothetical protein
MCLAAQRRRAIVDGFLTHHHRRSVVTTIPWERPQDNSGASMAAASSSAYRDSDGLLWPQSHAHRLKKRADGHEALAAPIPLHGLALTEASEASSRCIASIRRCHRRLTNWPCKPLFSRRAIRAPPRLNAACHLPRASGLGGRVPEAMGGVCQRSPRQSCVSP